MKPASIPLVVGMLAAGATSSVLQNQTKNGTDQIMATASGVVAGLFVQGLLDKAVNQKSSFSMMGLCALTIGAGVAACTSKGLKASGFVGAAGLAISSGLSYFAGSFFTKILGHKL